VHIALSMQQRPCTAFLHCACGIWEYLRCNCATVPLCSLLGLLRTVLSTGSAHQAKFPALLLTCVLHCDAIVQSSSLKQTTKPAPAPADAALLRENQVGRESSVLGAPQHRHTVQHCRRATSYRARAVCPAHTKLLPGIVGFMAACCRVPLQASSHPSVLWPPCAEAALSSPLAFPALACTCRIWC
jgi:hypothetical protein